MPAAKSTRKPRRVRDKLIGPWEMDPWEVGLDFHGDTDLRADVENSLGVGTDALDDAFPIYAWEPQTFDGITTAIEEWPDADG